MEELRSGTEAIKVLAVGGLGGTTSVRPICLRFTPRDKLLRCTCDVFTSSKLQAAPRFLPGNP